MVFKKKKKAAKKVEVEAVVETVATEEVSVKVKKAPKAVSLTDMSISELYAHAAEKGIKLARGLSKHEARKAIEKKS